MSWNGQPNTIEPKRSTLAQQVHDLPQFQEVKKLKLSWQTIHEAVDILSSMVKPLKPSLIVGISRGGLIPAVLLSHKLNVPMESIRAETYLGARRTPERRTTIEGWKPEYDSSRVVIVDDILDTGSTLKALGMEASTYWKFHFATLVNKTCKAYPGHINYVIKVPGDVWVEFPWEQDES